MRKFLCLRALVAIVIATLGVSDSFAQTGVEEQLVFLGTTMTKENGNNLDPEHKWIKSGTVKYDADTRTITLENAEIVVTKENCPQYQSESGTWYPVIGTFRFYCPVDKITVKLIGKNSIKTTQTGFVMLTYQEAESVDIDMIGGGSLTIDAGLNVGLAAIVWLAVPIAAAIASKLVFEKVLKLYDSSVVFKFQD